MISAPSKAWQLYIHVPFCERKCHYCDFASWESPGVTQRSWFDTVLKEIDHSARRAAGARIRTVFFGGGTPSVLPLGFMESIVRRLRENFDLSRVEEMTLEANPSSLTTEKLRAWRALGFGRVSLGVQSFDADELRLLGRVHSPDGAHAALAALASEPGLRFSGDLIFGIPGQSPERFLLNLETLMSYSPEHVSFYGLTVEEGTVFERWQSEGRLILPDGDLYRTLYREGVGFLTAQGLRRYEISNFARPGRECLHNQGYWNDHPYLAFGPGAHGYDGHRRWMNPWELDDYLAWGAAGFPDAQVEWDERDPEAKLTEALSLGLRQAAGFSLDEIRTAFGIAWTEPDVARWEKAGCLERSEGWLRVLEEGWPLLDEICVDLLAKARPARVSALAT